MEDIGVFKTTTFGGFDKKSVLTYIDSLNEQHHQAQEEANAKLAEYAKAQESQLAHIHHLEEQLADQEGKLNAVAEQLEQERVQARQALEQIAALEEKNQALEKQVSDGERELQIQLERCRQLQFKAESLDYKSKKYDAMSSQIGDAPRRTPLCVGSKANFPPSRGIPPACANPLKRSCLCSTTAST